MLQYRSKGLSILELWFDAPAPCHAEADVLHYWQRSEPLPGSHARPFHTLLLDLQRPARDIFAAIDRSTRAEIRRAESHDGVAVRILDEASPSACDQFCATYTDVASRQGLPGVDRERLRTLAACGMLALSSASSPDLGTIVSHAHLCCRGRARLVYSVTQRRDDVNTGVRSLTGRANRFLHWADIMHFRADGSHTYDFGGWYEGTDDKGRLGINHFKEKFGGRHVCEHNGSVPMSLKGKAFLPSRDWLVLRPSGLQTVVKAGRRVWDGMRIWEE